MSQRDANRNGDPNLFRSPACPDRCLKVERIDGWPRSQPNQNTARNLARLNRDSKDE